MIVLSYRASPDFYSWIMDSLGVYISLRGESESNLESTSSSFLSFLVVFYAAGLNLDKAATLDRCFRISLDDYVFLDLMDFHYICK